VPLDLVAGRSSGPRKVLVDDSWQLAAEDLEQLRPLMLSSVRYDGVLGRAARWHFAKCGKQLRARLATAACRSLDLVAKTSVDPVDESPDTPGTEGVDSVHEARWPWIAVCVQLLHEASLVHDDLQDGDRLRRGREAVWSRFGSDVAINLGDALIASAVEAASRAELPARAFADLADTVRRSACGQANEMLEKNSESLTLARYESLARAKTGPLLSLPVVLAMRLAGLPESTVDLGRRALECFGIAFQVHDDLADILGTKQRGSPGQDLREGKRTAPVLHYVLAGGDRALVEAALDPNAADACRSRLVAAIRASDAMSATATHLDNLLAASHELLRDLPIELRWTVIAAFRDLRASANSAMRKVGQIQRDAGAC
jgi:geranylgeranyl pyrophosphate synthase